MAAFRQNNFWLQYTILFALASFLVMLSACDGYDAGKTTPAEGSGALSFSVDFDDTEDILQRRVAVMDCAGLGITTIEAMIYDQDNVFLIDAGPWDCDAGQGSIPSVPAGSDRTVAILAKDGDGNLVYRGQKTGIDVVSGGESSAGTIGCNAFVVALQAPEDELVVPADKVQFAWNAVEGASEYRIVVSENEDLSDPFIDETTLRKDFSPSDLVIGQTYYWQVFAGDAHGNMGVGSQIWSFNVDITSNLVLDPTFSKTTSNTDANYWYGVAAMEWGAAYGYDSSPGIRYTIDGNENWLSDLDGGGQPMKHPVRVGDRLWIQCRVKRSEGADGTFRVGIQEWDEQGNALRKTITDVTTIADDDTWELVTACVTVYDAGAAFGSLLISPYGGTTGYFYIDDVVLSHQEPAPTDNADNLLVDPTFSETISADDKAHWDWAEAADIEWGATHGYNSSPGIRYTIDGDQNWFADLDGSGQSMKHPVKVGDRFWIKCRVKKSAGADGVFRVGIQEWDGEDNMLRSTMSDISTVEPDETWEWVSTSVTVRDVNAAWSRFTIIFNGGTTGNFYIDDVFLSRHEPAATENASNMVLDPTFSKTPLNNIHKKYWNWEAPIEWGPQYGYNSSPGVRFTIDGNMNEVSEMDGNSFLSKHSVRAGDELWIQCRVKKSAGADGIFRVGIRELDSTFNHLRNAFADVSNIAADETWQVVTASVTVDDPTTAFCFLLIHPYGGTTGYFYIDDVVLSRHEPY